MSDELNPHSLLICGESGHGKTMSLYGLRDRTDVLYLNCEGGKPTPFKNKWKQVVITDPKDILDYMDMLIQNPGKFNFVIIDTISFMMDMYETVHVIDSNNTQKAWGDYGQFFKRLINKSSQVDAFFIMLGHLDTWFDEDAGYFRSAVPVKGAVAKKGLEAYFTTVINVSKQSTKQLAKFPNSMLNVTEKDEAKGFKHVFQTETTKQTVGDRIRTPIGLFDDDQIYVDNDAVPVIKKMVDYYRE